MARRLGGLLDANYWCGAARGRTEQLPRMWLPAQDSRSVLGLLYLTAVSDAQREQEHCKVALTVLLVSSRLRSQLDYRVQQTVNELQHGHDYE